MKENQICYFLDDKTNRINFGLYKYPKMYGGHVVVQLTLPEIRLVNGIPFNDFKSEMETKKLPKGWTYNTQLFTITHDEEKKAAINEVLKNASIYNVSDLQWAYDNGYLIERQDVEPVIEAEIDHGYYRIVKKYPAWTQVYGGHNNRYPDRVFETFEKAVNFKDVQDAINRRKAFECTITVAYENLDWVLDRYESEHGGMNIENIRQRILSMPKFWEYMFRYYKGEILIAKRHDKEDKWIVVA